MEFPRPSLRNFSYSLSLVSRGNLLSSWSSREAHCVSAVVLAVVLAPLHQPPWENQRGGTVPLFVVLKEKIHKRRENRNSLLLCGLFWFVFSSGRENERSPAAAASQASYRSLRCSSFSGKIRILPDDTEFTTPTTLPPTEERSFSPSWKKRNQKSTLKASPFNPPKACFWWKRRNSGANELSALAGSERYAACDDEIPLFLKNLFS